MPHITETYRFRALQPGDIWYPGYDKDNMRTVDNELAALMGFVMPGVIEGWEVTTMVASGHDAAWDDQQSLINAWLDDEDSFLGQQLVRMNLDPKFQVRAATTGNITLSNTQTIDGVVLQAGDTVLVKDQTTQTQNGLYTVVSGGAWTRISALNTTAELIANDITLVLEGTSNGNALFMLAPPNPSTGYNLGTIPIVWLDPWEQVIKVAPGKGIVGLFRAITEQPVYFRYTTSGIFYVWAEAGLCLVSDGHAVINAPLDGDDVRDDTHVATYLATVFVVDADNTLSTNTGDEKTYVSLIEYEDRRNNLKNLEGAFRSALKKAFYKHVHLGGPDHLSKILLSTQVVLDAYGPTGSTIFILRTKDGINFSGSASDYGIPEVRLSNERLPPSEYTISSGNPWKLFLKNSVPSGTPIEVVLPLAPQVSLTVREGSDIRANPVELTDGIDGPDGRERLYRWDPDLYRDPEVYLDAELVSSNAYSIDGTKGTISFDSAVISTSQYTNDDLLVVLTERKQEVEGMLSGKRVEDINAASFTRGTLDERRILNLDHVGQVRLMEPAVIRPTKRLLSEGDHLTFYPEITTSSTELQYNTHAHIVYTSENAGTNLIGTKHGLLGTSDFVSALLDVGYVPDYGQVVHLVDEVVADPYENKFKITYALTREGKVFWKRVGDTAWTTLRLPSISTDTTSLVPTATSFHAYTERVKVQNGSVVSYDYYTNLVLGTEPDESTNSGGGIWTARIQNNAIQGDDWEWSREQYIGDSSTCYAMLELLTIDRSWDGSDVLEANNRTLYVGASDGFYLQGIALPISVNPKGFMWSRIGNGENNIVWWTDTKVFLSHDAALIESEDSVTWSHPLSWLTGSDLGAITVDVATASNITLAGGAPNVVDGVPITTASKILVRSQTVPAQNGVYKVSSVGTGSNGTWTRTVIGDTGYYLNPASPNWWVKVSHGTAYGDSAWRMTYTPLSSPPPYFTLGTTALSFENLYVRIAEDLGGVFVGATSRAGFADQYIVTSQSKPYLVTDDYTDDAPYTWVSTSSETLSWDSDAQGSLAPVFSTTSASSSNGVLYAPTTRGIFKSTSDLFEPSDDPVPWRRTLEMVSSISEPTVYDVADASEVDEDDYVFEVFAQSFSFLEAQMPWRNFLYENEYKEFYTDPWNGTDADVVVYIGSSPSSVPYGLDPAAGKITFTESLTKAEAATVAITILRNGAYISNTGDTPHEELPATFAVDDEPFTLLAQPLIPGDSAIVARDPELVDVATTYIEVRSPVAHERFRVAVDPDTRDISLPFAYQGTVEYPIGSELFVVRTVNVLGIQDLITQYQSGHTYHFHSVGAYNELQLGISCRAAFPMVTGTYFTDDNLFNGIAYRYIVVAVDADGLDVATSDEEIVTPAPDGGGDVSSGTPGTFALTATAGDGIAYLEWAAQGGAVQYRVKRTTDPAVDHQEISGFYGNFGRNPQLDVDYDRGPKSALFFDFATDQTDAKASASSYSIGLEPSASDSPASPRSAYVIDSPAVDGVGMRIGTEQGVWVITADGWELESRLDGAARVYLLSNEPGTLSAGTDVGLFQHSDSAWIANETYPQTIFDYESGDWGAGTFSAWGKDDGLAFVYNDGSNGFISDHFDSVDGKRVYGLKHLKFKRIVTDAGGGTTEKDVDALYLCTELGLFGVTAGLRGGQFSSLLVGREMFGDAPLMVTVKHPTEGEIDVPVKIYRIFQSPRPRSIPIIILTSNGVYVVRNWRWCDPDAGFAPPPLSFYAESHKLAGISCNCYLTAVESGSPDVYKIFVGTSQGVFKSTNDGYDWTPCNMIDGADLAVYDLKAVGTGILAATERGLFYSSDDGSSWARPADDGNGVAEYDPQASSSVTFNSSKLSMGFETTSISADTLKVAIHVSVEPPSDSAVWEASKSNTLTVAIYDVDVNGKPTTAVTPTTPPVGQPPGSVLDPYSITAEQIEHPGFKQVYAFYGLTTNTKYALVVTETLNDPLASSVFSWSKSTLSNPYDGGVACSYNGSSWDVIPNADLFFKVYFSYPSQVTETEYQLDFADEDASGRSFIVNDSGYLTTDFKLAAVVVVDDSKSVSWSDPEGSSSPSLPSDPQPRRDTEIAELLDTLWDRTKIGVGDFKSYADFWVFGTDSIERTNGYTKDMDELTAAIDALAERGNLSNLSDTVAMAVGALNPQAITDAIIDTEDEANTVTRVTDLVDYLASRNLVRLQDIRDWYAEQIGLQVDLVLHSPSNALTSLPATVYLKESDASTIYTWSTTSFPNVEIVIDGVLVTSNYTVNPTAGSITFTAGSFTPPKDDADLLVSLRVDWDGTATSSSIAASSNARDYVVTRWAKSFTPFAMVVADGDDDGDPSDAVLAASAVWDGDGTGLYVFGLGSGGRQQSTRTMADDTGGKFIHITQASDDEDWDLARLSFVHGGDNDLFSASWAKGFDFDDPTWIRWVYADYEPLPTDAVCTVEIRYTTDRRHWTNWMTVGSGEGNKRFIDTSVLGLDYRVTLQDGWSGGLPQRPVLRGLKHLVVDPSYEFYITPTYENKGMMFEYQLSAAANIPKSGQVSWGIMRGDSTDFSDFESVFKNRYGCLTNRQQSITYNDTIVRDKLPTTRQQSGRRFQAFDGESIATWFTSDIVQVFVRVGGDYREIAADALDGTNGYVYFDEAQPEGTDIRVTITTPERLISGYGESTTTRDGRTFYSVNGRWPTDATVVILVNGEIVRGGYWVSPEDGLVTFAKERERSDIVTIFVQHRSVFRVGAEVKNYGSAPVVLDNFGLYYSTKLNTVVPFLYSFTKTPSIVSNKVSLLPEDPTTSHQLYVDYEFFSPDGNAESGTIIQWFVDQGSGFIEILPENGFATDYTNKRIMDIGDVGTLFANGDEVYVTVTPSDGFGFGDPMSSHNSVDGSPVAVVVSDETIPYALDVDIRAGSKVQVPPPEDNPSPDEIVFYVDAGDELRAYYKFYDPAVAGYVEVNGVEHTSLVEWREKDAQTVFSEEPIIASGTTTKGQVFSLTVIPYNGDQYGVSTPAEYSVVVR